MRLVSLVPSLSELLVDLGLEDDLVGVTRFCERPEHLRETTSVVGGTKSVDISAVRDLKPDRVFAVKEENDPVDVNALRDVAEVTVFDVQTVPDACAMIRQVGTLTNTGDRADAMASEIEDGFASLPDSPDAPPRVVYLIWREPYMTVGGDTFIHDVLTRGGFANPFSDRTRYPEVTLDELAAVDPDVVFCSSEPFPFHQKERFTAALRDALPGTPVEIVDGQLFSWYGSRLLDTPDYLARLSPLSDRA